MHGPYHRCRCKCSLFRERRLIIRWSFDLNLFVLENFTESVILALRDCSWRFVVRCLCKTLELIFLFDRSNSAEVNNFAKSDLNVILDPSKLDSALSDLYMDKVMSKVSCEGQYRTSLAHVHQWGSCENDVSVPTSKHCISA